MPAFTKGKWEITGEKKRHLSYITCNISSWVYDDEGGSQIEIATVDGTNNAETRANARLIAAAPDMYEATVSLWHILKCLLAIVPDELKKDLPERITNVENLLKRIHGEENN